ncbi:RagB/SusD family nutrient uptake outer membrane protein [Sabulibacter ruber]|uniref:RagB/SusD family nutrient uptake outer membrane protein n=1 Tax=Sabulibacter ruber TaxID=2811901 RepID=UPI001A974039|nr:RagB/SusD family nutrient uptake outer membrane protein [Sabulibacter ruber]
MKHIKIFLAVAAICFTAGSCKDDLEATSYGQLSPINFPKTESDYELYALEAYKPFGSKWGYADPSGAYQFLFHGVDYSNILLNDGTSDMIAHFPEWGGNWDLLTKADFVFLKNQDRSAHFEKVRFVTRLTKMIDDLEKSSISEAKKKQLLGEVRMSRGWLMYNLLTLYGPVPVILDPSKIGTQEEDNLTRPDRTVYVNSITQDLRYAADNLVKTPSEYGRFNKGLALAVLMRTYLFEKDYAKAEQAGREILTLGYSLNQSYRDLFREPTEVNNETIWAVSVDPTGDGTEPKPNFNAWGFYTFPSDYAAGTLTGSARAGGWAWPGALLATWEFYDSFDPADKRRELLLDTYPATWGGTYTRANMRGPVINKYPDDAPQAFQGNDLPQVRYADVLLMLAEAINGQSGPTSEASGFVNQVRNRAGLEDLTAAETASKEAFSAALLRERAWELYFEGFRRVDLMRFGKWDEYLQAAGKTPNPIGANGYLPIPQYALNASKGSLSQTQGY